MKGYFLLAILFFVVTSSQGQLYDPFPLHGAKWSEGGGFCEDAQPCATGWCHFHGWLYCESNDSLIDGKLYSLLGFSLTSFTDSYNCDFYNSENIPFTEPGFIFGAIREDSTKNVWFRRLVNLNESQECRIIDSFPIDSDILLYDFAVQLGDTLQWKFFNQVCTAIDSFQTFDGAWHKRFMFGDPSYPDYWYEGIGSSLGLFGSYMQPPFEGGCQLSCFRIFDTLLISHYGPGSDFYCDHVVGINEPKQKEIFITPIPASDVLSISFTPESSVMIIIYDPLGRIVKKDEMLKGETGKQLSLKELSNGIYFLSMVDYHQQLILSRKIIVARE